MKVFISWSGERSQTLAMALREWLPLVLHYVQPWLSQSDIQAGDRWSVEIAKELESSNFGIICVTKDNLTSPWLLFESGALAKSMEEGKMIPLLLDLDFKEVSGPLAQFQAKKADAVGVKALVGGLNKSAAVAVPEAQVDKLFSALWGDLEAQIVGIPKSGTTKQSRPQGEILEELVAGVRSVEMRVRDAMDDAVVPRKRRRRMPTGYMDELIHRSMRRPGDPIGLLILASALRDEVPWLYELALEAYRALSSGRRVQGEEAMKRFMEAFQMLRRGPFLEDLEIDRGLLALMGSGFIEAMYSQVIETSGKKPSADSGGRSSE